MKPALKNVLAITTGWLGGSAVNLGLVQIGHMVFPIQGVDLRDMDALAEAMPTMGYEFFIFPFLAHALGTFVGALVAGVMAVSHKMKFAYGIGVLFLLGGIMVNYMLPGPTWFAVLDIIVAYIPMAYIGGKIALKLAPAK